MTITFAPYPSGSGAPGKACYWIAGQIREAIVKGELRQGDALPSEAQLITAFRSSRPSVREAIRLLEAEDLLQIRKGATGGALVRGPSVGMVSRSLGLLLQSQNASMIDVYDARRMIEPPAAALAARLRSTQASAALREIVDREERLSDDWDAIGREIAGFHSALLVECGNPAVAVLGMALESLVQDHQAKVQMARIDENPTERRLGVMTGFRSHRRLVDHIAAGEAAHAEAHWHRHMTAARDFWLRGGHNGPRRHAAAQDLGIDVLPLFAEDGLATTRTLASGIDHLGPRSDRAGAKIG